VTAPRVVAGATVTAEISRHGNEMVDFLAEVVNQDSPSTNKALCDKVGALFTERASQVGFAVERDPQEAYGDNLVARLAGSDAAAPVLLVGHMDTVFEDDTTRERPFTVKGDQAFGPGVYDMKAGLVIGLYAIAAARALSDDWRLPLTFVFNTDEEPGSPRSRDAILREAANASCALILEPGTYPHELTVERKGVGIFELRSHGRAAHAGVEPEKGVNSIVDLAGRLLAAAGLADPALGTSVNIGTIAGGTQPYVVPAECAAKLDVRVPTLAEQARIEQGLRAIAAGTGVEGATVELLGSFHRPPMELNDGSRTLLHRVEAAAESVGYPLRAAPRCGGASDGNLTAGLGLPTIDGMGADGGFAHRPDEYIELPSLVGKASVLCSLLLDLNASLD